VAVSGAALGHQGEDVALARGEHVEGGRMACARNFDAECGRRGPYVAEG
jgi:hypothetical protein